MHIHSIPCKDTTSHRLLLSNPKKKISSFAQGKAWSLEEVPRFPWLYRVKLYLWFCLSEKERNNLVFFCLVIWGGGSKMILRFICGREDILDFEHIKRLIWRLKWSPLLLFSNSYESSRSKKIIGQSECIDFFCWFICNNISRCQAETEFVSTIIYLKINNNMNKALETCYREAIQL